VLSLATLWLMIYTAWRGGPPLAIALMAAGFLIPVALTVRMMRASMGGVGGHTECVRASSVRPRLARSLAWLVGLVPILAGLGVAWLG
jgi:hypothetical protein